MGTFALDMGYGAKLSTVVGLLLSMLAAILLGYDVLKIQQFKHILRFLIPTCMGILLGIPSVGIYYFVDHQHMLLGFSLCASVGGFIGTMNGFCFEPGMQSASRMRNYIITSSKGILTLLCCFLGTDLLLIICYQIPILESPTLSLVENQGILAAIGGVILGIKWHEIVFENNNQNTNVFYWDSAGIGFMLGGIVSLMIELPIYLSLQFESPLWLPMVVFIINLIGGGVIGGYTSNIFKVITDMGDEDRPNTNGMNRHRNRNGRNYTGRIDRDGRVRR